MANKENKSVLAPIVSAIGGILAFLTILLVLFMYINGAFGLITFSEDIMGILVLVREIAIIAVLALTALEFGLRRHWIIAIIVLAFIAAVVIFMFFPGALPSWVPSGEEAFAAL